MNKIGYFNGIYKEYADMALHVSDLSIQRGYGVFDFLLERNGHFPFIGDYIDRFIRSAAGLQLTVPCAKNEIEEIIRQVAAQNQFRNSGIKLLLTGGYADDGYTPSAPNFIVINHPYPVTLHAYTTGAVLIAADYQRDMPEIKTINYLVSVSLIEKMKAKGATDVLFHKNGFIYECSRCNFFLIKDQTLITPGSGMLKGITRNNVLKLAKKVCRVEERNVAFEELKEANEAFITCTTKDILPVTCVDNMTIGDGSIGTLTSALGEKYNELLAQFS